MLEEEAKLYCLVCLARLGPDVHIVMGGQYVPQLPAHVERLDDIASSGAHWLDCATIGGQPFALRQNSISG